MTVAFARTCPAGLQEEFERVEIMVEDDASERAAILYSAAVQQSGTIGMNLPSWCQFPCACRTRLSFEFGGALRSYSEAIGVDATHGRPAERPKREQGWFSGFLNNRTVIHYSPTNIAYWRYYILLVRP